MIYCDPKPKGPYVTRTYRNFSGLWFKSKGSLCDYHSCRNYLIEYIFLGTGIENSTLSRRPSHIAFCLFTRFSLAHPSRRDQISKKLNRIESTTWLLALEDRVLLVSNFDFVWIFLSRVLETELGFNSLIFRVFEFGLGFVRLIVLIGFINLFALLGN